MANYNKVLLMGNLTRDPEVRWSGDTAIASFGMAVNRVWYNANNQKQEEVCFVDLTAFGKTAETLNEYVNKGSPLFVEGRLQFDQWDDRETGAKRSKLKVVVERFQFLGGREDSETGQQPQNQGRTQGRQTRAPQGRKEDQPRDNRSDGFDFDDIPFSLLIACVGAAATALFGA